MENLYLILRLIAFSQVAFLTIILFVRQCQLIDRLLTINALAICAYLLIPINRAWLQLPLFDTLLVALATLIPASIWLLCRSFFSDEKNIPTWFICVVILYMGLSIFGEQDQASIFTLLPQLIKLALVIHVIFLALGGRQSDLVQSRFNLRRPVAICAALIIATVILVEIWAAGEASVVLELLWSVLIVLLAYAVNLYLFILQPDLVISETLTDVQDKQVSPLPKAQKDSQQADIKDKLKTLVIERFYAKHGVTLTDLAADMRLPAHQLRQVINNGMGFRNFNQYLNHYRIIEASQRLLSQPELPILSIALDVGFRSLSSFNKSFKDKHQLTPSEYIQHHAALADSLKPSDS